MLLLLLLLTGASSSPSPHIIVIVADDLGWGDVSWRDSTVISPHLEDLAGAGVRLENHYRSGYHLSIQARCNGDISNTFFLFLTSSQSSLSVRMCAVHHARPCSQEGKASQHSAPAYRLLLFLLQQCTVVVTAIPGTPYTLDFITE